MMYVKNRSLMEVFPQGVKNAWKEWDLRVLILISLTLQIVLILLGKRRKYIARTWIRFTLWSAYLLADWIATVALGVISNNILQEDCKSAHSNTPDKQLMSFWAPFLLLHLGGPDTITAYSLEDNELWLRHLLGLVVQTAVALYVFLMAWPGDARHGNIGLLSILSVPMFEVGLIKYGERTWALRSANSENLRESMLTQPDPGPNYAKFMEEFALKKAQGYYVKAEEVIESTVPTDHQCKTNSRRELVVLKAYELFQDFKPLFVDLILGFQERDNSRTFFQKLTNPEGPKTAFDVIEVELGFVFDVLYTKAPVVYTRGGCVLRLVSFFSTFTVLVAFALLCNTKKYHTVDLIITYLLLVLAVLLEIYAIILMLRSNWTEHWLCKHGKTRKFLILPCLQRREKQLWSNSIAQYNLLNFCLRDDKPAPACLTGIQWLLQIEALKEKYYYTTHNSVSPDLKHLVFNFLLEYRNKQENKALSTHRGVFSLSCENEKLLGWSILDVEFDQSILIWHIATDLCYYVDGGVSHNREESKHISDYMLHLLVMCPYLLPIGIGMIRFRDTCAEAREFFQERSQIIITGKTKACEKLLQVNTEACKKLLQVNTEVLPIKVKGDRSKSVLFDACRLAKSLLDLKEKKWELMSQVWVEMLANAATCCRGNHHAQHIRKGGELLTHVWLLMAHLGITEQFQINQGHARAKLIAK